MASTQIVDNFVNTSVDSPQVAYVSQSGDTRIEAFIAVNNSQVSASYKAYIQSSTGILKPIRPMTIVVWGEDDLGVGLVNQVIPQGGSLLVESSSLDSIYFTVTGVKL